MNRTAETLAINAELAALNAAPQDIERWYAARMWVDVNDHLEEFGADAWRRVRDAEDAMLGALRRRDRLEFERAYGDFRQATEAVGRAALAAHRRKVKADQQAAQAASAEARIAPVRAILAAQREAFSSIAQRDRVGLAESLLKDADIKLTDKRIREHLRALGLYD